MDITQEEERLERIDECLGSSAASYLHHHYFSKSSKAAIVLAYWYHHRDSGDFVKHLFRRGMLPMMGVYVWKLLTESFNWRTMMEVRAAASGPGGGCDLRLLIKEVNEGFGHFGRCSECQDRERMVIYRAR